MNAIAVRRRWMPRFSWLAAIVTPIAVGLLVLAAACSEPAAIAPATVTPVALHVRVGGSDAPFAVNVHEQLPLEAIPVAADSTRLSQTLATTWTSADTTKATVTADGILHTRCVGQVDIRATALVDGRTIAGRLPVLIVSTGSACAP